mmetsp:Transcript_35496/g.98095  ORF Transcript_35496/g.98095 Transcript_35496/m.98095 type:complete len:227 (-) Transcript_35496:114-794(-)
MGACSRPQRIAHSWTCRARRVRECTHQIRASWICQVSAPRPRRRARRRRCPDVAQRATSKSRGARRCKRPAASLRRSSSRRRPRRLQPCPRPRRGTASGPRRPGVRRHHRRPRRRPRLSKAGPRSCRCSRRARRFAVVRSGLGGPTYTMTSRRCFVPGRVSTACFHQHPSGRRDNGRAFRSSRRISATRSWTRPWSPHLLRLPRGHPGCRQVMSRSLLTVAARRRR